MATKTAAKVASGEVKATGNQLAVTEAPKAEGPMVLSEDASWMGDFTDTFRQEEIRLPFLRIIQSNTPERNRNNAAYIQGAEEGMIFNTATRELFSGEEGLRIIPVKFERSITEWRTRDGGGGLVKLHGSDLSMLDHATRDDKGKMMLDNGNELVDAPIYYILLLTPDGAAVPCVLGMAGSGWRASRQWNSQMQALRIKRPNGQFVNNPPLFAGIWRVGTQYDKNEYGEFFRWSAPTFENYTFNDPIGREVLDQIRGLRTSLDEGKVKAEAEAIREDVPTHTGTQARGNRAAASSDDIPF